MTDDSPPDSLIPYDEIVQDALRGVVYGVLRQVEADGELPGDHHFYIAFETTAEGVDIPDHLRERYPEEMTIVIQHRYWDLNVGKDGFEIGLSFNQVPTKLGIPYDAITGFVDPSVNFALQFQVADGGASNDEGEAPIAEANAASDAKSAAEVPNTDDETSDGSNVVTLDAFRKK